jgi:hypothetical protein
MLTPSFAAQKVILPWTPSTLARYHVSQLKRKEVALILTEPPKELSSHICGREVSSCARAVAALQDRADLSGEDSGAQHHYFARLQQVLASLWWKR